MNTIGQILKDARTRKGVTLKSLEKETKIKKEFILRIENNDWQNLPDFPVVSGFVKNISESLGVSVDNANAVLRRDYPPKKMAISPKPDIDNKFKWTPRITFFAGISMLVILVLSYLVFEYFRFMKPPDINIDEPKENQLLTDTKVLVKGSTTTDSILTVNNQPVILDQNGGFETSIEINKDTKEIVFKVVSRSGKVREISRKINPDF